MSIERPLIMTVERFLRDSGMRATTFGRLAMRDPCFVFDLRRGREPGHSVRSRVEHFMNIRRAERQAGTAVTTTGATSQ